MYLFLFNILFNKNPYQYSITSVDFLVHPQGVLEAYKVLSGSVPTVQAEQMAAVPGAGSCIYLVGKSLSSRSVLLVMAILQLNKLPGDLRLRACGA